MDTPKTMSTELLTTNIENAIRDFIPLFKVTEKESAKFEKPTIRRFLSPDEYPEHPRATPAHSALDNFIYFPMGDNWDPSILSPRWDWRIFSHATIHPEVGHCIHYFVNPSVIEGIYTCLRTGKRPPCHYELTEFVAEYGNFILGLRDSDEISINFYTSAKRVYDKHGPEFLPKLARMTLEEAIKEGVVKG